MSECSGWCRFPGELSSAGVEGKGGVGYRIVNNAIT